ncbi:primase alpha helix C-terminal domain-containing protein, partial [Streptomyces scabiei]|uniref:primase alpha helix C-terminal domain-containing protein n=1 Tax=Streptomyces scabiei TaxID=1930 RepID=UPI0029B40CB2|nr:primase alpha helix C-terminal domain-containing protein [Streptomyces scabiei]
PEEPGCALALLGGHDIVDQAVTAGPAGPVGAHGHGLIHFVLTAQEGQRNTRLFWAACRAYENGLGPDLTNALVEAAVRTGLTEREARSTVASAARMSGRRP